MQQHGFPRACLALCGACLRRSVEGQLLSLCWRENTFSLALETDYAFAAVAGSVDLRELDAVRRSYVRSLQEMCCVLDQLKASPALTGAAE